MILSKVTEGSNLLPEYFMKLMERRSVFNNSYCSQLYVIVVFAFHSNSFAQVIKMDTLRDNRYFKLGFAQFESNDFENAMSSVQLALRQNPMNWHALRLKGDIEHKQKKYAEAEKSYTSTISINKSDTLSYRKRADARRYSGDYRGAADDYDKFINLTGTSEVAVYYGRALCRNNLKLYSLAIDDYNKIAVVYPKNSQLLFERGVVYFNLSEYSKAIKDFGRSIQYGGGSKYDTYYYKGLSNLILKKIDSSRNDFRRFIEYHKDDCRGYIGLGEGYGLQGDSISSDRYYSKALALCPDYPDLYFSWGQAKMNLRKYTPSTKLFEIALKKGYDSSECYERMGTDQSMLRDTTAAVESFEKAIKMNPKFIRAYEARIELLLLKRNAELQNREDLDRLLDLVKDSLEISKKYALRSYYDLKLRDTVQAYLDIDRAVYAASRHAYPFVMRAWFYSQLNSKNELILSDLKRAIELNAKFWQVYILRAMVFADRGDFKHACEDFKIAETFGARYPKEVKDLFCGGKHAREKKIRIDVSIPDPTIN